MKALDGRTELQLLSFQAPKIRLLRSLSIVGSEAMQVAVSRLCYFSPLYQDLLL